LKGKYRIDDKGVAAPLEFTVAFGVVLVVFFLVFSTTAHLFVQYEVKEYDFRAKALDISERLMKDVGRCKDGSSDWEYQPENLTYLGLAMPVVLYDAWLTDQGFVPVVGNDTNITRELIVNAGGPYYGYINEPIALDEAYVSGGVPPYSYQWVVDTSNLVSIDPPDGKAASVTVVYSEIGKYSASLVVTDSAGTTKSDSTLIWVSTRPTPTTSGPNCEPLPTKSGSKCTPATGKIYSTSGSSSCIGVAEQFAAGDVIPATVDNCDDDGGGGTCFLAGTKVAMADGSYKNIEDIKIGDMVKAFDENTGEIVTAPVTEVFHHSPDEMGGCYLVINDFLRVTPNHMLFVDGGWKPAGSIAVGDALYGIDGNSVVVSSIKIVFDQTSTYNLEIAKYHTYFADNILAHNAKEQVTSDPCCNGPRPVPTLTQACDSLCTTREGGCYGPTESLSKCLTSNPGCNTCYGNPAICGATRTPGNINNPQNKGGLAPKKYSLSDSMPISVGESPLFSYFLNDYTSKRQIIVTPHYIDKKEQTVVVTINTDPNNRKARLVSDNRVSNDISLFANSISTIKITLRRTVVQSGGTNVIAYQKIVKDGSQSYVTRTWSIISNLADYGLLSPEKIKAINKLDYNKVREALGLESGYDFNIKITTENGTELLRYGKAFDTARDVVSFSRTVLVYPDPDLDRTSYVKARLTVYVFR